LQKVRLGLFDDPYTDVEEIERAFDPALSTGIALQLSRDSLVLLSNDGLLPLSPDVSTVAVIGPNADSIRNLFSGYTPPAGVELEHAIMSGSDVTMAGILDGGFAAALDGAGGDRDGTQPTGQGGLLDAFSEVTEASPADALARIRNLFSATPTVLEAIQAVASASTKVLYDEGCELTGPSETIDRAVAIAQTADVAVLVLGDKTGWAYDATGGESRDRSSLRLPGHQERLLEAVCRTGTPVVVVLVNGRPLPVPDTDPPVRAVIEGWQPGAAGGQAIAECLFGLTNPGGRLPMTIPRSAGQCPIFYGRKSAGSYKVAGPGASHNYTNEPGTPSFVFGHGLSYTTFRYDLIKAELDTESVGIGIRLTNTGVVPGDEVVQVYIRRRGVALTQPVQKLVAFQRLKLEPGQSRIAEFDIKLAQLATVDSTGRLALYPGPVSVMVGSSSADIRATVTLDISAGTEIELDHQAFFAATRTTS
jgi:beta-glucosidase